MNQNQESDKLRDLLVRWSAEQEIDEVQQDDLARRISKEIREANVSVASLEAPIKHSWSRVWISVAAIAASFLVGIGMWRLSDQKSVPSEGEVAFSGSASASERSLNPQSDSKGTFYAEMQQMFENRVAWVAEAESNVWFELDQELVSTEAPRMVIRMEIFKTSDTSGSPDSKPIWKMDFVVKNQQVVEVRHDKEAPEVILWPYMLEDGSVAVETQLNLAGDLKVHDQLTSIFSRNESDSVQKHPIGSYELRQSLSILEKEVI